MSTFAVWVQPVDEYTTPDNLDNYGSVHDVEAEYEDDEGGTPNKQFCDGQTSKTPPRYATDRMVGIYTRSREAADIVSGYLREDVRGRILSGSLRVALPLWFEPTINALGAIPAPQLNLLRARAYHSFPRVPEADIDAALEYVVGQNLDGKTVKAILAQMQRRLSV